jgi:hypothetical protein
MGPVDEFRSSAQSERVIRGLNQSAVKAGQHLSVNGTKPFPVRWPAWQIDDQAQCQAPANCMWQEPLQNTCRIKKGVEAAPTFEPTTAPDVTQIKALDLVAAIKI